MLYPLSYILVGAEGSDDRRHAVLQGSRASEAFRTSAIGDHRVFTSSLTIITHSVVVVKKIFGNFR